MATFFFLSSNPTNLAAHLGGFAATVTVEAEYGDVTVPGTRATLAHHGRNAGNPAPCAAPNGVGGDEGEVEAVGLSHIDLDSAGGCAAVLGRKPDAPAFWALAEFVDLNGPHRLAHANASDADLARLHAFWAWSNANRVFAPRDGGIADVTAAVLAAVSVIERICADDVHLLAAGEAFRAAGERLNADSFRRVERGVVVREASAFTNHIYTSPSGEVCAAVVGFNPDNGSVTVSFADPVTEGDGARGIVQRLWGPLAGGHAGIAGSPREARLTLADVDAAAQAVADYLAARA